MYKLKDGIVLKPYGSLSRIDNSNLTDDIAKMLISKGRAKEEDFIITKPKTKTKNKK